VTVEVEVDNRSGWAISSMDVRRVVAATLERVGVGDGEVGVAFVPPDEIAGLNAAHRGKPSPTDVLSFPIDGAGDVPAGVPRQLGDLVVCPEVARSDGTPIEILLVHGALHLAGFDHEADGGEMLARQDAIAREVGIVDARPV
jgi:probable rRNA maturation factor